MILNFVRIWLPTLLAFLLIDMVWLGIVMKDYYRREMGDLLRIKGGNLDTNWVAAMILYALMVAGLVIFVLPRLKLGMPVWEVFGWGFLYGVIMYSVYDLTNLAILKNWPVTLTIVDMIWGGVIFGICSVIMLQLSKIFA